MKFISIVWILFFVLTVFTGLNEIGQEIYFNSNLDDDSKILIQDIYSDVDSNWNSGILAESGTILNTSTEGQDAFAKEYLDRQSSSNKKTGILQSIKNIPDTIILSLGFDNADFEAYLTVISALLVVLISIIVFVMFFGEGKLT